MNSRLMVATVASLSLGLVFVAHTLPSQAETIIAIGEQGAAGINGGNSTASGTDGGPGGSATAVAGPNSDFSNIANATGGAGGRGGVMPALLFLLRSGHAPEPAGSRVVV